MLMSRTQKTKLSLLASQLLPKVNNPHEELLEELKKQKLHYNCGQKKYQPFAVGDSVRVKSLDENV